MRKFGLNKKLGVALVAIIGSFLLIAFSINVRNNRQTPPIIQQFGNDAAAVVDSVVAVPLNGVKTIGNSVAALENTYQQNEQLKKQVTELGEQRAENRALRQQNKQLQQELSLNHSLTAYDKITAAVVTRAPSSWQNIIVINKGSRAGIKKNQAVMSQRGLIGRVIEVNQNNSKLELLSTKDDAVDRVPVEVQNKKGTTVNGLITGYNSTTNQLIMGQVTNKDAVKVGTQVTTSGLGGITPKGLLVGKVVRVENSDYGMPAKIYIQPAADMTNLSVVTVIKR